jgi:hypothetical protein
MSYSTPDNLQNLFWAKTPGEGIDPDDAQIPDVQDPDLDDDLDDQDDESGGDEGIDDPDEV